MPVKGGHVLSTGSVVRCSHLFCCSLDWEIRLGLANLYAAIFRYLNRQTSPVSIWNRRMLEDGAGSWSVSRQYDLATFIPPSSVIPNRPYSCRIMCSKRIVPEYSRLWLSQVRFFNSAVIAQELRTRVKKKQSRDVCRTSRANRSLM